VWRPGSARTRWGNLSALPGPLATMRGPSSKGRGRERTEGKEGRRGEDGRGREGIGGKGKGRKGLPRFKNKSGYALCVCVLLETQAERRPSFYAFS